MNSTASKMDKETEERRRLATARFIDKLIRNGAIAPPKKTEAAK